MASTLDIVNNQLLQEGVSSNQFLRRQMLRKMSQDTNYDEAPAEATQPTQTYNTSTNYEGGDATLASTYSKLLNNYNAIGGSTSSGGGATQSNTYDPDGKHLNIPSWAPLAANVGFGLAGLPKVGAISSAAGSLMRGDTAGGIGKLSSLFTNNITKGKYHGLGSLVGTLAKGLVNGDDIGTIGGDLLNTGLGSALSAVNPALGLGYGIARLFGLDVSRGIADHLRSDYDLATKAGYNGGFWGDSSWTPTAPYNPNGTYSGSGYGNTAGPGSTYKGEPTHNYGTINTGVGSGFNSANWGSGLSGNTSDDSGSDY